MDLPGLTAVRTDLFDRMDRQELALTNLSQAVAALPDAMLKVPRTQTQAIKISASGWNQVIPPNPNHIHLTWLLLVAQGTVTVQLGQGNSTGDAEPFHSVSDPSAGNLALVVNAGFNAQTPWPSALLITDPGRGLFVKLSAAVAVEGYASYVLVQRDLYAVT